MNYLWILSVSDILFYLVLFVLWNEWIVSTIWTHAAQLPTLFSVVQINRLTQSCIGLLLSRVIWLYQWDKFFCTTVKWFGCINGIRSFSEFFLDLMSSSNFNLSLQPLVWCPIKFSICEGQSVLSIKMT